ncbi:MAG: hypothetical protein CMM87_05070 [Rickettsiales bacterium]|nr:hypothetical protein [Rickettsiales bacterium]|tara:strand:+ start:27162 stop:27572 length:411 start_codon:yes stop_codon:yes gene_type:complete
MNLSTLAANGHQILHDRFPDFVQIDEIKPFSYTKTENALLTFISLVNSSPLNDIINHKMAQVFDGISSDDVVNCLLENPLLLKWFNAFYNERSSAELGSLVKALEKKDSVDKSILSFISLFSLNKYLNKAEQRLNK